jgi:hypothetical protein
MAEVEMCAFVCAGLSAGLTLPGEDPAHALGRAIHDLPVARIHASRPPELNDRPPKPGLL